MFSLSPIGEAWQVMIKFASTSWQSWHKCYPVQNAVSETLGEKFYMTLFLANNIKFEGQVLSNQL